MIHLLRALPPEAVRRRIGFAPWARGDVGMKRKVVILGVGSTYFTRSIIEALIRVGGEWEVAMVDIDERPLGVAMRLGQRMCHLYDGRLAVTGSVDRRDVLEGAGTVVSVIGVGGRTAWMDDLLLGRRHGAYQTTADTSGIGGLSRALRTVPQLLAIARDIEELCPDALLVNFTNPMSVNCRALALSSSIRTIGLCTGVRAFHHRLAERCGVDPRETRCEAIGVNHFTWITSLRSGTEELLDRLLDEADGGTGLPGGRLTTDLFRAFRAFPVVGDHHISEFIPTLLGEGQFYGTTLGFDGERDTAAEYFRTYDRTEADMAAQADGSMPIEKKDLHDPDRQYSDEDFFAEFLDALEGNRELQCTVNLPNVGQCVDLPRGAIVESTAVVDAAGVHPFCAATVSPGLSAILHRIITVHELVARAAMDSDRTLAVQALLADLTARSLAEAEAIVDDILQTHQAWLPQFPQRD